MKRALLLVPLLACGLLARIGAGLLLKRGGNAMSGRVVDLLIPFLMAAVIGMAASPPALDQSVAILVSASC